MSRWVVRLLQLAVAAALVAALVAIVDWDHLRETASNLSPGRLVLVAALCLCAQAVLVLRWRALLAAVDLRESWARSWDTVFAGLFLTNFLPGVLGSDGLRVLLLTRSCGRASTAIGAVGYERLMQLSLYVGMISLAALMPSPWLQPWHSGAIAAVGVVSVLVLIAILSWLGRRPAGEATARAGLLWKTWRLGIDILAETGRMQARMHRHRGAAVGFWGASIVNICLILAVWYLVLDQFGARPGLAAIMLAAGGAAIVGAIPISVSAIGTFEVAIVTLLGLAGVGTAHAFLLALIVRAGFMVSSFVGLPSAVLLWRARSS